MRLFQNSGLYPAYLPRLRNLTNGLSTFESHISAFLNDRFGAAHFLLPVLEGDSFAFFTNGDEQAAQRQWAREQGISKTASLQTILLAQIEHHRSEVFYNMDPMRYGSEFVRKLPGSVKRSIAWRAAPSPNADFSAYDLIVCNFPSILDSYRKQGWNAAYFSPALDPETDSYGQNSDRPIDVMFVGGYSRHHRRRAEILEAVAGLRAHRKVVFHLDRSRLTRIAESPLGRLLPLREHRRQDDICRVSEEPVFGRALYAALSQAKIVLNGAIDMAGEERGNMRCFEAMGCGAVMVGDAGRYPDGMVDGETMLTYKNRWDALQIIETALRYPEKQQIIARNARKMLMESYGKEAQWQAFQRLLGDA